MSSRAVRAAARTAVMVALSKFCFEQAEELRKGLGGDGADDNENGDGGGDPPLDPAVAEEAADMYDTLGKILVVAENVAGPGGT